MEQNRQHLHEEGESSVQTLSNHRSKRRRESQQSETLRCSIFGIFGPLFALRTVDIPPCVEESFRIVVREELAPLNRRLESNNETTGTCEARIFRLYFKNNELPATIFTFSKIKAKDETPVEVALYDTRSMSIVSEGPLSSIKVKICVLHSDFGTDDSEEWSEDQFKVKIALQRQDKGELLKGNVVITLKDGVGYIPDIEFTDNSCWTRSRHFRLGAIPVKSNLSKDANIMEGISTPFMVKDRRGERNQKRFPPIVTDEVWRLNHISKDGKIHRRLTEHGVNSVGDLRQLHATDPSSWKKVFAKIPKKKQEAIIEHANTSVADQGQNCINSQNILNSHEKVVVETIALDDHLASTSTINIQTAQYGAPDQALPQLNLPITPQEENHEQMMNYWEQQFVHSTYTEVLEEMLRE